MPPDKVFDWPSLMDTERAGEYTNVSRWTLARAVRAGLLPIAGRRGRSLVFRRTDLDAWMIGGASMTESGDAATRPVQTRRVGSTSSADALARLKLLKGGAQ